MTVTPIAQEVWYAEGTTALANPHSNLTEQMTAAKDVVVVTEGSISIKTNVDILFAEGTPSYV